MKNKVNVKLELMPAERMKLRANKIKIRDINTYSIDALCEMLNISMIRAMEIYAHVEFQQIPSIGIKFTQDLISMGYYSLKELKGKDGALLTEEFEFLKEYWIDPCVEDQFRLVVHYANTKDDSKNWWDFTLERKMYRIQNGYPSNRPKKAWFEVAGLK